jgi:hypothetical protein
MTRTLQRLAPVLALTAALACGAETGTAPPEDLLTREEFVAVYVELRQATLVTGMQSPTPEIRNEVLERMGVEPQQLMDFVDYWGRDVATMRSIWEEIDSIIDANRLGPRDPDDEFVTG